MSEAYKSIPDSVDEATRSVHRPRMTKMFRNLSIHG